MALTLPYSVSWRRNRPEAALRAVLRIILTLIPVLSVAFVIQIWRDRSGMRDWHSFDSALGSIGALTGLLSAVLMIVAVWLMARIPVVEAIWGHDVLAQRHRWVAFASFWLMLAHVATFAIQRIDLTGQILVPLKATFITSPWMLLATLGTLLLIFVTITSIRAARLRMPYESWYLIHLYTYLGMLFAFPHQLFADRLFHFGRDAQFWWALYLSAVISVVIFRFGLPAWRSWRHDLRVDSVTQEAPGVFSIAIAGRDVDRLRARSGQFFTWRFLDGTGWLARANPYSLSAAPRIDGLRFTVEAVGESTERASQLKPGTRVLVEGPYGVMNAERRARPKLLFIAAGIGITPLRAMLEDVSFAPGDATLLYRISHPAEIVFREELDALATRRGITVHYLTGRRRSNGSWLPESIPESSDTAALLGLVPDAAERELYLCGPEPWQLLVRRSARRAGVANSRIHSENYFW